MGGWRETGSVQRNHSDLTFPPPQKKRKEKKARTYKNRHKQKQSKPTAAQLKRRVVFGIGGGAGWGEVGRWVRRLVSYKCEHRQIIDSHTSNNCLPRRPCFLDKLRVPERRFKVNLTDILSKHSISM